METKISCLQGLILLTATFKQILLTSKGVLNNMKTHCAQIIALNSSLLNRFYW